MEYAAPVWHTGLTAELVASIKSIQKCALRISFGENSFTISSYHSFCDSLAISSLHDRRDRLLADFSTKFFTPQAVSITSSPIFPPQHSYVHKNSKTLSRFTLSVITSKIHNYISICIVYLYFKYINMCYIIAFVYSNFLLVYISSCFWVWNTQ